MLAEQQQRGVSTFEDDSECVARACGTPLPVLMFRMQTLIMFFVVGTFFGLVAISHQIAALGKAMEYLVMVTCTSARPM